MIKLLEAVVSFVYEALKVYAASDQGKQDLVVILDAVENAGIDVPFYEPSNDGESGSSGVNDADLGGNYSEEVRDYNVARRPARVTPKGDD